MKHDHHNVQHPMTAAQIEAQKQSEHDALVNQITDLEKRVTALEARKK